MKQVSRRKQGIGQKPNGLERNHQMTALSPSDTITYSEPRPPTLETQRRTRPIADVSCQECCAVATIKIGSKSTINAQVQAQIASNLAMSAPGDRTLAQRLASCSCKPLHGGYSHESMKLLSIKGPNEMPNDSVFQRRLNLEKLLQEGALDGRVLDVIVPDGKPLPDEDFLWDFKSELPVLKQPSPSDDEKLAYSTKMAEIVKDAVSFYNMYGGYLIVGVRDSDKSICGFRGNFDVNDLCKKIHAATKVTIDAKFRLIDSDALLGQKFGILFVPMRPLDSPPCQFQKDAPTNPLGKKAYAASDFYLRSREECKKANTSEDYAMLFSRKSWSILGVSRQNTYIENNLPAKDPTLIQFIGRNDYLNSLWQWLTDRYTATKLLSGAGGVGKTTIAWEFCDAISKSAPIGIHKVIWLTAKQRTYAAVLGKYVEISHTHFNDLPSLLTSLLGELGVPEEAIPEEANRDDLIEACIEAVRAFPCLLVVDDIDSLPAESQFDVFRTISTIFDRVIATGGQMARALLTARLNLGAAPGQLLVVNGLNREDFFRFAEATAEAIGAPLPPAAARRKPLEQLFEASNGSPLFASAILSLAARGMPLGQAIKQYKGADGEEVRRFAFERELDALTDSQIRILFAAVNLVEATIENIAVASFSNLATVRDGISTLRDYHLASVNLNGNDPTIDEIKIVIPSVIRAMTEIVRKKISDPARIETACAKLNRRDTTQDAEVGRTVRRILACWSAGDFSRAVDQAKSASQKYAQQGDVWCLLGRAYLSVPVKDAKNADIALRKASELGCSRPELFSLRLQAKEILGDWVGIVSLVDEIDPKSRTGDNVLAMARGYKHLADDQYSGGASSSAADYYLKGGKAVQEAFHNQIAHGFVAPLRNIKHDLLVSYFDIVKSLIVRSDDKIRIWDALKTAIENDVFHRGMVGAAASAAVAWSEALLSRPTADTATLKRLVRLLDDLKYQGARFQTQGSSWAMTREQLSLAAEKVNDICQRYEKRLATQTIR